MLSSGMEAVGVVTSVGPGLTGRKVGDLVGYAGNPMGSYAEEQILPAEKVVPVPSTLDPVVAAAVILKGMTAQYLVRRCFKVCCMFTEHLLDSTRIFGCYSFQPLKDKNDGGECGFEYKNHLNLNTF